MTIKTVVLYFNADGVLRSRKSIKDTGSFVSRTFAVIDNANWIERTEQFMSDLKDECCPVIDHPTNGSRLEFLLID